MKTEQLNRQCGDCQACCFTHGIEEINKPKFQACPNQCLNGCSIYGDHPPSCKNYTCLWIEDKLPIECKPDLFGIVLNAEVTSFGITIMAFEAWEDSSAIKDVRNTLEQIRKQYPVLIIRATGVRTLLANSERQIEIVKETLSKNNPLL